MSHFVLFVPAYNAEPHLERCLESISNIKYSNFEVVLIDDASTDSTPDIMEAFSRTFEGKCQVIHNDSNLRMPRNLFEYVHAHRSPHWVNDIIFILDGDDFLPHPGVLSILDGYYGPRPELALTYGSFLRWPDPYDVQNQALPYPQDVVDGRSFRQHPLCLYNHPITFKQSLFQELSAQELQHEDGTWFGAAYDHSLMMPMLELTAPDRYLWLPDFLYVYNEENELSEYRVGEKNAEASKVHTAVDSRPRRC